MKTLKKDEYESTGDVTIIILPPNTDICHSKPEPVITIDFGEVNYCYYNDGEKQYERKLELYKKIKIYNQSLTDSYCVSIVCQKKPDFPVYVVVCEGMVDNFSLNPVESVELKMGLICNSDEATFLKHSKNSFFNISSSFVVYYHRMNKINGSEVLFHPVDAETEIKVHYMATLCTSILYVEEREIFFPQSRDIQVWNRSENTLHYSVHLMEDDNVDSIIVHLNNELVTNKQCLKFTVAPFASHRLSVRVLSTTEEKEGLSHTLLISNLFNPSNQVNVVLRHRPIMPKFLPLLLEEEIGSTDLLSVARPVVISFGECYVGLSKTKNLFLSNLSNQDLTVQFSYKDLFQELELSTSHHIDLDMSSLSVDQALDLIKSDTTEDSSGDALSSEQKSDPSLIAKELDDGSHPGLETNHQVVRRQSHTAASAINDSADPKNIIKKGNVISASESLLEKVNWTASGKVKSKLSTTFAQKWGDSNLMCLDVPLLGNRPFFSLSNPTNIRPRNNNYNRSSKDKVFVVPLLPFQSRQPISIKINTSSKYSICQQNTTVDCRSLSNRCFDLDMKWSSPSSSSTLQMLHVQLPFKSCESIVTVSPQIVDLGTCYVGEFKIVEIKIKNESDLPANVYPYIDPSETMGILQEDKCLTIAPKQSKPFRIEYVAKSENENYKRIITLINANNSKKNTSYVQVKAENNDSKQILLHSKLYRINTYNSKRQPQIFFESCLANMPNFRVFSIKNIQSEPLCLSFWKNKNSKIQLFKVRLASSLGHIDGVTDIRKDEHGDLDTGSLKKTSQDMNPCCWNSLCEYLFSSILDCSCQSDLEDLKWGQSNVNQQQNKVGKKSDLDDHQLHRRRSFGFKLKSGESVLDSLTSSLKEPPNSHHNESFNINNSKATTLKSSSDDISHHKQNFCSNPSLAKTANNNIDITGLEDLLKNDKGRFPFDLLDDFETKSNTSELELKIKYIKDIYNQFKLSLSNHQNTNFLESLSPVTHPTNNVNQSYVEDSNLGQIIIPRDQSCYIAVLLQPNVEDSNTHHGNVDSNTVESPIIRERTISDYIQIRLQGEESSILPRNLPIYAKVISSEMMAIQKNISFGKTLVGDQTKKIVTLVNKSNHTCIFSVSKSGSISSSYITIPLGRKGWIAPFSSVDIEFIFKPTLPGSFEETLTIENILNPCNIQSIVIKAKVTKKESYTISQILSGNNSSEDSHIENSLLSSSKPSQVFDLGNVIIGQKSQTSISFKIKNVTSKKRQFILDASHSNAIVLIPPSSSHRDAIFEPNILCPVVVPTIFEPIPEILQSVLALRCSFNILKLEKPVVNSCGNTSELTGEERNKLKDDLEHFQQKLKIAIRKNKDEKIIKYQKKIDGILSTLSDSLKLPQQYENEDHTIQKLELQQNSDNNLKKEQQQQPLKGGSSNDSDVTFHFSLDADEEKVIIVNLLCLPGMSYRRWYGFLSFSGYLRVFECKNEDFVNNIGFNINISLPLSDSSSKSVMNDFKSLDSILVTIAQWSSIPTTQIYDNNYRNNSLSLTILPVTIKLVQASNQERVMYGALSIASTNYEGGDSENIHIDIGIEDFGNKNYYPDNISYNALAHGPISFGMLDTSSRKENRSIDHMYTSANNISDTNDNVIYQIGEFATKVPVGNKLDLIVQWKPSEELNNREAKKEIKLVGVLNIQYRNKSRQMLVPFVCTLEHKSSFKLERYYNFETVYIGSYRMCQINIVNLSMSEKLHYVVTSEEVGASSRAVGKLEVMSGQTGVILPNSHKSVGLMFSATNIGKFEQKLWVKNIRDAFDQKRISIQATVLVSLTKFIVFPDLEFVQDKYKPIDLGLIQVLSPKYHEPSIKALSDLIGDKISDDFNNVYKLEMFNVSDEALRVTALSNLRSQCFIYTDNKFENLAINTPIDQKESLTLFVKIRPSNKAINQLDSDMAVNTIDNSTRNLIGGIRLLFYSNKSMSNSSLIEEIDSEINKSIVACSEETITPLTPLNIGRKIFDTVIPFTCVVGKSVLSIKNLTTHLRYVTIDQGSQEENNMIFGGKFELSNLSSVFNLNYCYFIRPGDSVIAISQDHNNGLINDNFKFVIEDNLNGLLGPNEIREINYRFITSRSKLSSGLFICNLQLYNVDTLERHSVSMSFYFNLNRILTLTSSKLLMSSSSHSNTSCESSTTPLEDSHDVLECEKLISIFSVSKDNVYKIKDNHMEKETLPRQFYVPTNFGIEENLCTYSIFNNTTKSITLTPISDLPINVLIYKQNNYTDSNYDESIRISNLTTVRKGKLALDFSEVVKAKRKSNFSELFPSSLCKFKDKFLTGVGDAFTLEPKSAATLVVFGKKDLIVDSKTIELLAKSHVNKGKIVKLRGIVALLQSAHSLQSIFNEKPEDFLSEVTNEKTDLYISASSKRPFYSANEFLPILSLREVEIRFIAPQIKLVSNEIFINNKFPVRCGDSLLCEIIIENNSEVNIPLSLELLPSWLCLSDESPLVMPKKMKTSINLIVSVPFSSVETQLTHTCHIKNLLISDLNNLVELMEPNFLTCKFHLFLDKTSTIELIEGIHSKFCPIPNRENAFYSVHKNPLFVPSVNANIIFGSDLSIKNSINQKNQVKIWVEINSKLKDLINLSIYQYPHQELKISECLVIEIDPMDILSSVFIIEVSSLLDARIAENNDWGQSIDTLEGDSIVSYLLLGTLFFKSTLFSNDLISIDILGTIIPAETMSIKLCNDDADMTLLEEDQCLLFETFKVDTDDYSINNKTPNDFSHLLSPLIYLKQSSFVVILTNISNDQHLRFSLQSLLCRHAGMKLKFGDGVYDCFVLSAYPSTGCVPPNSSLCLKISIHPLITDIDKSNTFLEVNMNNLHLSLNIIDLDYGKCHPPTVINVVFRSNIHIPVLSTQPVSIINRDKQHLDVTLTDSIIPKKHASSDASHCIRLRGLTPLLNHGSMYSIDLGLQSVRLEAIEWLVTLENRTVDQDITYSVKSIWAEDENTWLRLSRTRGVIPSGGSTSLMLYFLRAVPGKFSSYLIIQNLCNKDRQVVKISMEIARSDNDNLAIGRRKSFVPKTIFSASLNQLTSTSYFIYVSNMSDVALDFTVTSTIPCAALSPLTLLSSGSSLHIKLNPRECNQKIILQFEENIHVGLFEDGEGPYLISLRCDLFEDQIKYFYCTLY